MAVTAHGPLSYYRGLSLRELGRKDEADALFRSLLGFAESRLNERAKIDYFATSLPNLLVFDEDLQARRNAEYHLFIALAHYGLGDSASAKVSLQEVLAFDSSNQQAVDLQRRLSLNDEH